MVVDREESGGVRLGAGVLLCLLALVLTVVLLTAPSAMSTMSRSTSTAQGPSTPAVLKAMWVWTFLALHAGLTEGGVALAIFLAAGGWGYLLLRKALPHDAPTALGVFSACGLGLWMISTALLLVGSSWTGLLRNYVWWPVVGAGIVLAAWQGRRRIESFRFPRRVGKELVLWLVLAAACGYWIAGASVPPGAIGLFSDQYDVLAYHLQVPREYFDAQHIRPLENNCYSFYPLGSEMLFLLAMVLRDGPCSGMYAATMTHGMFAALAVFTVLGTLRKDQRPRARASALAMATCPLVIYMSWMAMEELAQLFYFVLALLWLGQWLRRPGAPNAVGIGLALGGACAVKYLSVGFILAPVLAVMLIACLLRGRSSPSDTPAEEQAVQAHTSATSRWRGLAGVALACLVALVLFSPWLIRNCMSTRNPVFPLATSIFGRGHWSPLQEQRWRAGTAPDVRPPVPVPAGWQVPTEPGRPELFYRNLIRADLLGPIVMIAAGLGVLATLLRLRRASKWDVALVGVLGIDLVVWTFLTHQMPTRFLLPVMAPVCLLAGGFLQDLSRVQKNPFARRGQAPAEPWGPLPALVLLVVAIVVNLAVATEAYRQANFRQAPPGMIPLGVAGDLGLPSTCRFLLVGQAPAFYFPQRTIYATAFDSQPLEELSRGGSPGAVLERLRKGGVDYIWVDWSEMWRLANTYGLSPALSDELFFRFWRGDQPGLKQLEDLEPLGLRKLLDIRGGTPPHTVTFEPTLNGRSRALGSSGTLAWPQKTVYALPGAPVTTLPASAPGS